MNVDNKNENKNINKNNNTKNNGIAQTTRGGQRPNSIYLEKWKVLR